MAKLTKKPLQIYLDTDEDETLRYLARKRGKSMGALIRESVARYLAAEIPVEEDPALGIIGLGRSGITDLSENHDKYLAEMELEDHP